MAKKRQKPHGHYCRVCGEYRANEAFSGKGHDRHICKSCMKLSPEMRSKEIMLHKIEAMSFRYLNDSEIKWLRSKMGDRDEEIRTAACESHRIKFPNYERNMEKKGLIAFSLDYFIHTEIWDGHGNEIPVYLRFSVKQDGEVYRIDYTQSGQGHENRIQLGSKEAKKLLKYIVQQLNAPFWKEDLNDLEWECISGSSIDLLPEHCYSEEYVSDVENSDMLVEADQKQSKPICILVLDLNNSKKTEIKFYHQLHTEAQELFWILQKLFEEEMFY